ncbi:hypothetical protein BHM03_00050116 [Ensete ventricosum]|nr:hypothetical protein BHM03_00050116 [Ensete ventricosum]
MEGIIGSEESAMLAAAKGIATVVGEAIGGIVGRRWQRRKMTRLEAGLWLRGNNGELQRKAMVILAKGATRTSCKGILCCRQKVVNDGSALAIIVAWLRSLQALGVPDKGWLVAGGH